MRQVDRRTVLKGTAALGALSLMPLTSRAAEATKIRFAGSAAVARPDQGFMFAGIPTGFYRDLSVEADFITVAGSAASLQLVLANEAQIAHVGMLELLSAKAKTPSLPVRAVYLQELLSGYEIVVPEEGAFKNVADLKGHKIGVLSLASGAVPFVKAMLSQAGVDLATVELLPVGAGAQALAALRSGQVDALSLFRGSHAAIENLGVKLRYLTVPLPSSVMVVHESLLKRDPDGLTRALQGLVMNTAYLETNPKAGVRCFWEVVGKPAGDEEKQLSAGAHLIQRAAELWKQVDDPRPWGEMTDKSWTSLIDFMGANVDFKFDPAQLDKVYTNELIPAVNKADVQKAIAAARNA